MGRPPPESPQPAAGPLPALPSRAPRCLSEALEPLPWPAAQAAAATPRWPHQLLASLWYRPTQWGGARVGRGLPFFTRQSAGSELTLVLISRPCSPSREKNDQILIQEKAPNASPKHPGLRFQECLKVLALLKLLSWRGLSGRLTSESAHSPPSALTQASVLAGLRGVDLASPLGPCLYRGLCTQPPSPGPASAEHPPPPLLLTPPAVAWVTPLGPAALHWNKPTCALVLLAPRDFTRKGEFQFLRGHQWAPSKNHGMTGMFRKNVSSDPSFSKDTE